MSSKADCVAERESRHGAPPAHAALVRGLVLLVALLSVPASSRADEAPPWLVAAATTPLPAYDSKVPAVVLLDEERISMQPDGRLLQASRFAVRILQKEGRRQAIAQAVYVVDAGSVRSIQAWLVHGDGTAKRYGGSDVLDLAVADNDVYNEVRRKQISAVGDAEPGTVFGFEIQAEDRPLLPQVEWFFQGELPVLASRLQLSLPPGWRAEAITFNHDPIVASQGGGLSTWELRDLPFLAPEPARPGLGRLAPRLAITICPPAEHGAWRNVGSWAEVAGWLSGLHDPQAGGGPAVRAKARELTQGATSEVERIRAIARFCQSLHYVSIQTGLGRGGGYRPHHAELVLAKGYGDCKDKANLMRALLAAVQIESWPLVVFSSDRDHVREEWPSAQQFDHCILAVRVAEGTPLATVTRHPTLGLLLVFDPTSASTVLGDLPADEQGSLGLLVHARHGGLLRLPETSAEANLLERTLEASLDAEGRLTAKVRELAHGQAAARRRYDWTSRSAEDYAKLLQRWVAEGAAGALVRSAQPADEPDGARFRLELEVEAARYAQLMQRRLLVFRPTVLPRREAVAFAEPERRYPVVLAASSFSETARFSLPDGFVVDELPDPVSLQEAFGSYTSRCELHEGRLVLERNLRVRSGTLPKEEYPKVRAFFEAVRAAERAPAVLARR
jgi:hypothetical protein